MKIDCFTQIRMKESGRDTARRHFSLYAVVCFLDTSPSAIAIATLIPTKNFDGSKYLFSGGMCIWMGGFPVV
jgi:hypothetical protein